MALFDKIDAVSLTQSAVDQLMSKILSGELKAGDHLPAERDLAERMGISRSSLHQAILQLENQGFLSVVPRKGTVVNDFRKHPTTQSLAALMSYGSIDLDHSLFEDMMDTRIWLETECARRACTNIYDSTLEDMRRTAREMTQPGADLTELIYSFHYMLTQASGNSLYTMIFRGFEPVLKSLIRQHYAVKANDIQSSSALRLRLLDAIETGDADLAQKLVREVICQGIDVLEARYNR